MIAVASRSIPAAALAVLAVGWCRYAAAYRPFDGTDAAVADPGDLELELGPAGMLRQGSERTLIAPAVTANLGLGSGWEAVLQGQAQTALPPAAARLSLAGNGAFLKQMVRDGVLQGKTGPSVATEFGLLLPGVNEEAGLGGSWATIVSYPLGRSTAHFNAALSVTRQQRGDVFLSTILEGPRDWKVRPVAEVVYEHEFGGSKTLSGLIGVIWPIRDNLALDFGLREGRIDARSLSEVRLGLTVSFPIWRAGAD